jgi:pyrroloquinoline-quinone synthase
MDLTTAVAPYRLLDHPFYRRWEAGALAEGELAAYAGQYRHFEVALPGFLADLVGVLDGEAAELVVANLADEVAGPETHLELFDVFIRSVGATDDAAISPAMAALVGVYTEAVRAGDAPRSLGVLAGYEIQAAEVAQTKVAGLVDHYGVDAEGSRFWHLHAELEASHAAWTLDAARGLDTDAVAAGARDSAAAWWAFLDEREALAA